MPSIDINANTRQAQAQVKDLSKVLDDTADALDDLAREGDQAGDKLERSFRDMVRDAGKADKAIEKIGDSGGKGFGKASKASGEFKAEALANVSEVTSSFNGSMTSIGDLAQGTLGGLATSGIPAVGAAAAVAAVGVGLITAEISKQAEDAKKLRERLGAAYQEAAEDGRDYLDVAQLIGEANDLMFNPDRAEEYKKLKADAKALSLDESTLIKANAGDLEALAITQQQIDKYLESQAAHGKTIYGSNKALTEDAANLRDRWKGITDATNEQADAAKKSREVTSDFLKQSIKDAGTATQEVDKFGNELYTLPNGEQVVIDAETGQASRDLAKFKGDVDKTPKTVTTTMKVKVDDSAWRNYSPKPKSANINAAPGQRTWE